MKISFESIPHNVNDKKKREHTEHDVKKFLKKNSHRVSSKDQKIPNQTELTHGIKKKSYQSSIVIVEYYFN